MIVHTTKLGLFRGLAGPTQGTNSKGRPVAILNVSSFINHYFSTSTITFQVFPFLYDAKVDVEDVDVDLEASSITSRRSNNISHCLYIS
nr:7103_t:CDS:2 [Entrophospora candida]